MAKRVVALVPAAGRGARMGSTVPKQFLLLGGLPLLVHSLRVLQASPLISEIILAVPESDRHSCEADIVPRHGLTKVSRVVAGGAQRQDSVRHALEAAGGDLDVALVHDAVRPFLTDEMIERVIARAREVGGAIVAVPMRDTVKVASEGLIIERTVERQGLWLAQTPQAFRASLLREAHEKARVEGVQATDDALLLERYGHRVAIVEGRADNIKITRPEDLVMGEAVLAARQTASH